MHSEILDNRQIELLPLMARSIDFDLFKLSPINHKRNLDKISATSFAHMVTRRVAEQMNLIVNDVKVTFFQYPFPVEPTAKFESYFRLPSLLQLAAMKALHDC